MLLANNQSISTATQLAPAHLDEWVTQSGIDQEIVQLNLKSIDNLVEIAKLLNWQKYFGTAGWYVLSCDPLTGKRTDIGQFKPEQPIQFPNCDKPQKYFSFPKDGESSALYLVAALSNWVKISQRVGVPIADEDIDQSRSDLGFWRWVLNHPEIPILITEGAKKAACLLSHGWVAIALTGVWNGQKRKKLHPSLVKFIVPGRPVDLVFDADVVVKQSVQDALQLMGHLIHRAKGIVRIATWDLQLGKGCDDLIVAHGSDKFELVMDNAKPYSEWLKGLEQQFQQFSGPTKTGKAGTQKVPPADTVAHAIAAAYRDQLAFNNETGRWLRYGADSPGVWSVETEEYIEAIVGSILDGKGITGYGNHSYLTNVVKTLRRLLIVRRWSERSPKELLPFINGVLEVATGKLLPHSPGYRLTWQLPRHHDPHATDWSTIDAYLDHLSGGKPAIKEILLCFCNAVLTGRSDLQKFLHLIGLAGSGKGTFARLLTDLIGADNIYSGTLEDWCSNRFESANAYKQRLVVFWDEDKQTGKLGKFLSLTGGDWIRAEEKGKKAFQYRYDGMVVVLSNLPIFTGDAASRIARRVITVPCNSSVPIGQRRDLNAEFTSELDAFTNHVLSIPDAHVTRVLTGLVDIPECTLEFWENRIRTDSIAAWLNDWVIYDVLAETPIGSDKNEWEQGTISTLYGSYCYHCKQSGTSPKANKNFSPDLLELCRSVLGWEVERKVTKTGKLIRGLRLRTDGDVNLPTHDYLLMQKVTGGGESDDEWGDGSQPLPDKDLSQSDGSTLTPERDQSTDLLLATSVDLEQEVDNLESPQLNSLPVAAIELSPPAVTAAVTAAVTTAVAGAVPGLSASANALNAFAPVPASQSPEQPTASATAKPPQLAAIILGCQTWVAAVEAMDAVATAVGKQRQDVFKSVLKQIPAVEDRQHLVKLLAEHIQHFPRDFWAYSWLPNSSRKLKDKALAQANQVPQIKDVSRVAET